MQVLGILQSARTECSQQALLGTTWVSAANGRTRTNKYTSINTAQSAKRKTPDGHMIRPDHDSRLYRTGNQSKKVRNARYPQCPGLTGAEAQYCWAHLALAAFPWLPQRDTQDLVLPHPHSARNRGNTGRSPWSHHPNGSLAVTPDSQSIKQLWANSLWAGCRRAVCLFSQGRRDMLTGLPWRPVLMPGTRGSSDGLTAPPRLP